MCKFLSLQGFVLEATSVRGNVYDIGEYRATGETSLSKQGLPLRICFMFCDLHH